MNIWTVYVFPSYRFISAETTVPDYLSSSLPGSHLVTDTNDIPIYQRDSVLSFLVRTSGCIYCLCIVQLLILEGGNLKFIIIYYILSHNVLCT